MLKRAPSYRTLELELLEWQERELFEYFVVVSLKKKPSRNTYLPEVSYQFPKVRLSPPLHPSSTASSTAAWPIWGRREAPSCHFDSPGCPARSCLSPGGKTGFQGLWAFMQKARVGRAGCLD